MSDEDYASFLDKANQDTGASKSKSGGSKSLGTKSIDADVPKALQNLDEFYISEADEPFEPVSLRWDGDALPGDDEFASLIGHKGEVEEAKEDDFDPQGQYEKVVGAVKKVGSSSIKFYRVEHGGTRTEWYVVSLDKKGGKIVGMKAVAVQS